MCAAASASAQTPLRIFASNVTSGNNQQYITAGTSILDGLNPDVVLMQEFNVPGANENAGVTAWVNSTFGAGYIFSSEPIGGGVSIPNGSGTLIDPTSGLLPTTGLATGLIYRRNNTSTSAFSTVAKTPVGNATPGTFAGVASGTGTLVITEIADAAAVFANEYIEFYHDASGSSVSDWSMY